MHLRISLHALPRPPPSLSQVGRETSIFTFAPLACLLPRIPLPPVLTLEGKEHTRLVHTTYTDRTGRSRFNKKKVYLVTNCILGAEPWSQISSLALVGYFRVNGPAMRRTPGNILEGSQSPPPSCLSVPGRGIPSPQGGFSLKLSPSYTSKHLKPLPLY